jgi:hypothetical protein
MQARNAIAERHKGAADLAIAAFVHGYAPGSVIAVVEAFKLEFAWPVVELDTVITDHLAVEWLERLTHLNFVDLDLLKFGVRELLGELAIIGQE